MRRIVPPGIVAPVAVLSAAATVRPTVTYGVLLLVIVTIVSTVFLVTVGSDRRTANAVRLLNARWAPEQPCWDAPDPPPLGPPGTLVPAQRAAPGRTDAAAEGRTAGPREGSPPRPA